MNKTGTCITSSLKYDPTSPPSPIRSHSYEEKQQQKELLLQQHRELQKRFLQMKHHEEAPEIEMDMAVEGGLEMGEVLSVQENVKEEVDENESKDYDDKECQEEENIQEPEVSLLTYHHHCCNHYHRHPYHHHYHCHCTHSQVLLLVVVLTELLLN